MMTELLSHPLRRDRVLAAISGSAIALLAACPVSAQAQQLDNQPSYSVNLSTPFQSSPPADDTNGTSQQRIGAVATSSVGTIGQRQEKDQVLANIKPTARLETRIANRVQSRIRNRIDRFYDPQANA